MIRIKMTQPETDRHRDLSEFFCYEPFDIGKIEQLLSRLLTSINPSFLSIPKFFANL